MSLEQTSEPRPSRRARRRAKKAARSTRRRRLTRTGIGIAIALVAIIGAAVGYTINNLNQINKIKVDNLIGAKNGLDNILMVGSTSRCAVKPAPHFNNFVQQCEQGTNGVNSDVVMILHIDTNDNKISLLSIPRDTFIPNSRAGDNANRIDAALADGPSQLVDAIEEDFGIPINHYVVLNFQSFANIVTALGGVKMYFPTTVKDLSGLYVNRTGCVKISGLEALALVRARHMYYDYDKKTGQWLGYDGSGDLGRIERDHLFLKVLASEVEARGLSNPVTDENLLGAIAPELTVDNTLSTKALLNLMLEFHSIGVSSIPELTVPISEDTNPDGYEYKGYPYGDIVFPVEPNDQQTIDTFLGSSPAGLKISPHSITVAVVDGNGSPSDAAQTASQLRDLGYDVVAQTSQTPVGPIAETEVLYGSAKGLDKAERVMANLRGTVSLGVGPAVDGADVTLVTGTSYAVGAADLPGATTAAAIQSAAQPTATVSGPHAVLDAILTAVLTSDGASSALPSTDGGVLSAPTSATTAIPWYDPRACTASELASTN